MNPETLEPAASPPAPGSTDLAAPDRSRPIPVLAAVVVLGIVATAAMLVLGGGVAAESEEFAAEGVDPGRLTIWAIPMLEFVARAASIALVGCLLVPLLIVRRLDDELGRVTRRATRAATWAALVWALASFSSAIFEVSDAWALPVADLPYSTITSQLLDTSQGQAALIQVVLVLLVAAVSRWVATARETTGLLGVALLALIPPVLTGHSASAGSHDLAIVSMVVHVLAAVVWIGGVIALWWHLADAPRSRSRAVRRFSAIATAALGLTAVSGLISAFVRVDGVGGLFGSAYGAGALAKTAALILLGIVAFGLRSRLAHGLAGPDTPDGAPVRTFLRLTGAELAVMSVAVGLGVALSRTPPPAGDEYASGAEALLGGPLPPAPSLERLIWNFNPSGVGLLVVLGGLVAYAVGVRTVRRRGDRWPVLRTISFIAGLAVIAYATLGGLGVYSHVLFSAHMVSHMLLSMVAPILLVAGAPITLALNALPGSDVRGGQGPRQLLAAALQSRVARVLSHPLVTAALFVGSLYGIYFTGAFEWLMTNHLGHAWMELHFLITGYLFYESLIGIAPVPHRLPYLARLGMLVVVAPFHAFFSITLMGASTPVAEGFYAALNRPYATDLLRDQNVGGSLSWAIGEIPILMVVIILLFQWLRSDRAESRRYDRREDASDDAEWKAYNERLAAMGREIEERGGR